MHIHIITKDRNSHQELITLLKHAGIKLTTGPDTNNADYIVFPGDNGTVTMSIEDVQSTIDEAKSCLDLCKSSY